MERRRCKVNAVDLDGGGIAMTVRQGSWLRGWRLLGVLALLVVVAAAATVARAPDVDGVRAAIRLTARTSLVLFTLAFTASAAFRLWPSRFTRWQRQNRRQLGLAFAVSHGVHLVAIIAFARLDPHGFAARTTTGSLLSGSLAYAFIAAMSLTSFDRTAAWLGARRWRILHGAGSYYIWMSFVIAFAKRVPAEPAYLVGVVILGAALGARWLPRCPFRRPALPSPS
jgi:sulfoxide reductase heme-binding subunit YedZ